MPTIRQLPTSIINKIAAGEVIERPASVVKEMLENSIDAGATRVELTVEKGGVDLIRISDNGCGIDPEQLLLAVAPHATSKLITADDLFDVDTLGFRGEALASIAEISHLSIRSRTPESDSAAELIVRGGEQEGPKPCAGPVGTTIEVRHLFFNTPVRRKFLKSPQTEMGHVTEAFTRIAIAFPQVHMVLISSGRTVYDLPPCERWSERIRIFFGDEVGDALITIDSEDNQIHLRGYVTDPSVSRSNNRMQYLFLNGRHIRDRSLQHALSEAYRGLLMVGRFPVCFLRLDMPPADVDVNVHPTKSEVRFSDSGRIYGQLLHALRHKFLTSDLTGRARAHNSGDESNKSNDGLPSSSIPSREPSSPSNLFAPIPSVPRDPLLQWAKKDYAVSPFQPFPNIGPGFRDSLPTSTSSHSLPTHNIPAPSMAADSIGSRPELDHGSPAIASRTVHDFETERRAWSASHEGARSPFPPAFEDQDLRSNAGPTSTQTADGFESSISPPDTASDAGSFHRIDTKHVGPAMSHLGFQVHNRYLITQDDHGLVVVDQHALHERIMYEQIREKVLSGNLESQRLLVPEPVTLSAAEAAAAIEAKEILGKVGIEVEPFGGDTVLVTAYPTMLARTPPGDMLRQVLEPLMTSGKEPEPRDLIDSLLHMISCKAAIKAGDRLTSEEITSLLEQRHFFADTHHCPHGRPTALFFSREQLDKLFKRI